MSKFSRLKARFTEYQRDPKQFIDWDNGQVEGNRYFAPMHKLTSVCDITYLGCGSFSSVYVINEDPRFVLKVVNNRDDEYARFVRFINTEAAPNPYYPRVFYESNWGGKQVYILERLYSPDPYLDRKNYQLIQQFIDALSALSNVSRQNPFYTYLAEPYIYSAVQELSERGMLWDCTGENVLMRFDGTPVISDPCSG